MSQAAPSSPSPVVDYNARPAPRRGPIFTPRIILFVLVFGAIIGLPAYMFVDYSMNHGIKTRADGVKDVDLKSMSLFPLDQQAGKTDDVPARFRELDGQKVSLVGEMWTDQNAGDVVGQFDLVYSIAKCCFSGPPQVQHFVKSTPREKGTGMPYYRGLVRVTGTLSVGVQKDKDADKVSSVYRLVVDSVEPI